MLKALTLPKGAKEELDYPLDFPLKVQRGEPLYDENDQGDDENKLTAEQKLMMDMFGEGKFHMIPSFFRTLVFNKKQKREFSVIFRSMGNELDKIVWEFNQFCIGQHPCFSGRNGTPLVKFDGSKGTKDLRIKGANQQAIYFRESDQLKDTYLVTNADQRVSVHFSDMEDAINQVEEYEDCKILKTPILQYQHILETLKKNSTMTIQDDAYNWEQSKQSRDQGRLLLVD